MSLRVPAEVEREVAEAKRRERIVKLLALPDRRRQLAVAHWLDEAPLTDHALDMLVHRLTRG